MEFLKKKKGRKRENEMVTSLNLVTVFDNAGIWASFFIWGVEYSERTKKKNKELAFQEAARQWNTNQEHRSEMDGPRRRTGRRRREIKNKKGTG